jgi:2-polyprenyl-3-methyl-5-hydroxy-6-metoxy-1,4-benzoquinol methylase
MKRFWHLGRYRYAFYRFTIEQCFRNRRDLVLDAGCGSRGSLQQQVSRLVGVDILRENIRKIRQTKQGDFLVASLTHLPFRPSVFDAVVCVDVLEHIKQKKQVVEEFAKVSRMKANLVGSTTNLLNPFMLFDSFSSYPSKALVKYVGQHYERHSRLTPKSLVRTLSNAGYSLRMSFYGEPPLQPWLYEFSNKKVPWYAHIWILFDRLPLKFLKEDIVFVAVKGFSL